MSSGIVSIPGQHVISDELSPANWAMETRARVEVQEATAWAPSETRPVSGKNGIISAIASPIAVQAGMTALRLGGTAADAAATVALTQITTQLGSVASFAGILSMIYYDAKTRKIFSMDAGYNSYLSETDPLSIPVCDLGPLNNKENNTAVSNAESLSQADKGRETLVPGFMAGIEAMHKRFGKLPFAHLFEPAIWYAENGTIVNPTLEYYFVMREKFLARTQEGRDFLRQAGVELPKRGNRFCQPQLAEVLRMVAQHGAQYMYAGPWGQHFVEMVRREGGKVTLEDMSSYEVIWSEPYHATYLGHNVYTPGSPSESAYHILTSLNLMELLRLEEREFYWKDPMVLRDLQRIADVTDSAPWLDPAVSSFLKNKGIDVSPAAQLSKDYAEAVAPLLGQVHSAPRVEPRHSDSMVVIDKDGNIAAITHSINSVIWGDSGIVVDGIPIPDSAGHQQARLASIKPGDRVPSEMTQTIICDGQVPIMATAAIGSSLIPETLKIILGIIGKGLDLKSLQAAPPVIYNFMLAQSNQSTTERGMVIPDGAYGESYVASLQESGQRVTVIPHQAADAIRGTVVAVTIDSATGEKHSCETPKVLICGDAY